MRNKSGSMRRRGVVGVVLGVAAASLLGGCSNRIHETSELGTVRTLSIDAKQRIVVNGMRTRSGDLITCAEPSPDALTAAALAMQAANETKSASGASSEQRLSGSFRESAASIGYRDQLVQMFRDGYYRMCEAYMNGSISRQEYQAAVLNIDTFMVTASAISALGGNRPTPLVILGSEVTETGEGENKSQKIATAGGFSASSKADSAAVAINAAAIKDVVAAYFAHKTAAYKFFGPPIKLEPN